MKVLANGLPRVKNRGADRNSLYEVPMSKGQELLHPLHDALATFEKAVVQREHKKPFLDSKISLQQDVDNARQRLVDTVVELVKEAREAYPAT